MSHLKQLSSAALIVVLTFCIAPAAYAQEFDEVQPPEPQQPQPKFEIIQLPKQTFLLREMQGSYEQHSQVIPQLYQDFGPRGIDLSKPIVGFYLNDPAEVEEPDLRWKIGIEVDEKTEAFDPYIVETTKPAAAMSYETTLANLEAASKHEAVWLEEKGYEKDGITRMEYVGMNPNPDAMKVIVITPVKKAPDKEDNKEPRNIVEATFADMQFLTGDWLADMDGDIMLEQWGPPIGNAVSGSFQYVFEGKTVFMYELMSIQQNKDGEMILLLRHFDADFTPWPNHEPLRMKLGLLEENVIEFINQSDQGDVRGIRYESPTENELIVSLLPRDMKKDNEVMKFERIR